MKLLFEWTNEWVQLFEKCNWYTITFWYFYFEYDHIGNALEILFILFGVGFRVRCSWNFEGSELGKLLRKYEEEEKEGGREAWTRVWEQTHQNDDTWLV